MTKPTPIFIVEKDDNPDVPYNIRHTPSGLFCGYFTYQRYARQAAAALNALAESGDHPSLYQAKPSRPALNALLATRKTFIDMERAQLQQKGTRRR